MAKNKEFLPRALRAARPLYKGGPTAKQLQSETEKQRRVPGVVFADGPTGRRARVAGTGIDVFEVISTYRAVGNDREKFSQRYEWLSSAQLDAAIEYAVAFPEEIEGQLRAAEDIERRYRESQAAVHVVS